MPAAVIVRVACPECGAQKGEECRQDFRIPATHFDRYEALWNLNRRIEAAANVNDRPTP